MATESNERGKQCYLAGGWFTPRQEEALNEARNRLAACGYEVYDPQRDCLCPPNATDDFAKYVLSENCKQIRHADFVYASIEGRDLGTSWEIGYAISQDIPVVYHTTASTLADIVALQKADFGDELFISNLQNDKWLSDGLIVNTAGKDPVAVALAGYAYGCGAKIVYLCEGLPPGAQFNLMLAKSGVAVATSQQEADEYLALALADDAWRKEYTGAIE